MAAGAAAEVDDPSLAATLEKFRLYETRAVSTSPHHTTCHLVPHAIGIAHPRGVVRWAAEVLRDRELAGEALVPGAQDRPLRALRAQRQRGPRLVLTAGGQERPPADR